MVCSSLRLARENKTRPFMQLLIYPWLQLVTALPSMLRYRFGLFASLSAHKTPFWYMGITNVTDEMLLMIRSRAHSLLVPSHIRAQFKSYLDPFVMIPEEYRHGRDYYEEFRHFEQFKDGDLSDLASSHILNREPQLGSRLAHLFTDRVSPLLASSHDLARLPKTYMVVCEWDSLKDEGLIFAQRLRQNYVNVTVAFYDTCFHAMVNMLDKFKLSARIIQQLNSFLKQHI